MCLLGCLLVCLVACSLTSLCAYLLMFLLAWVLACCLYACLHACASSCRSQKIKLISFLFPKQLSWFHEETRNTIFVNSTIASNYFYFMVVFLETRSNDINGHHVLWLVTMSSDWSPCPPIVIMSIMLIMILSILVIMPTSRLCGQGA